MPWSACGAAFDFFDKLACTKRTDQSIIEFVYNRTHRQRQVHLTGRRVMTEQLKLGDHVKYLIGRGTATGRITRIEQQRAIIKPDKEGGKELHRPLQLIRKV
jgi:hypothetical protein